MIFNSMSEAMTAGERIEIRGLGSFVVKEYGAYMDVTPKPVSRFEVKPKKLPFFKVGKELKERILDGE